MHFEQFDAGMEVVAGESSRALSILHHQTNFKYCLTTWIKVVMRRIVKSQVLGKRMTAIALLE
jgi:hypothetical protein